MTSDCSPAKTLTGSWLFIMGTNIKEVNMVGFWRSRHTHHTHTHHTHTTPHTHTHHTHTHHTHTHTTRFHPFGLSVYLSVSPPNGSARHRAINPSVRSPKQTIFINKQTKSVFLKRRTAQDCRINRISPVAPPRQTITDIRQLGYVVKRKSSGAMLFRNFKHPRTGFWI